MSAKGLKGLFRIEKIGWSGLDGKLKALLYHVGDIAADAVYAIQHIGFASVPSKAQGDEAPEAFVINIGGEEIAVGSRDLRHHEMIGNLKPGETCIYAAGDDGKGQARMMLKDKGVISIFTKKNAGAKAMTILMDPNTDTIGIVNSKGYGLMINENGTFLKGPSGALKLDDGGVSLIASKGKAQVDGETIVLGAGPCIPGVDNALTGITGLNGVAKPKVFIPQS